MGRLCSRRRQVLPQVYCCPACRRNKKEFALVYKLAQDIIKDPADGRTLYLSDELETLVRADGKLDLDVRCGCCGYLAPEDKFII
ncbi:MAG TPA: hypothetical protein GXX29_05120 [Firmicutes bacterium]|nr:hypothetical protein [Bacillota bacterium]